MSAPRILRAGPLSLRYAGGEVRAVRLGEIEIAQRIYGAVRDRNWGTVPPQVLEERISKSAGGFRVEFQARHQRNDIDFRWRGEISGQEDGTLRFSFDGEAKSGFLRNRIGLCVLHPLWLAGEPVTIEHPDGSREAGEFPFHIAPHQPFTNVAAFEHEFDFDDLYFRARVAFAGEVFETEDQRNWSDASFKTYGTPLSLPFPVRIEAGERVRQSVTISPLDAVAPAPNLTRRKRARVWPVWPDAACALAPIGLSVAPRGEPLSEAEAAALQVLAPSYLRVEVRLNEADCEEKLRRAVQEAGRLNAKLEIAAFIGGIKDLLEVANLRERVLDASGAPQVLAAWLFLPPDGSVLSDNLLRAAREYLGRFDSEARFGSGSNANFTELNRARPPFDALDFVAFALNPQVHATDSTSLFETPTAMPSMMSSARELSGGRGVAVSPITLRPRFNAVATGAEPELAPGELPANVDARQKTLEGAAWTLAALAALLPPAPERLTFYETTGWRGVLETVDGKVKVFPLFHVLAWVDEFAGGEVLWAHSDGRESVAALALRRGERRRVLVANTSGAPVQASIVLPPDTARTARVLVLDESSVAGEAEFARGAGEEQELSARGLVRLRLGAYAVARVDF